MISKFPNKVSEGHCEGRSPEVVPDARLKDSEATTGTIASPWRTISLGFLRLQLAMTFFILCAFCWLSSGRAVTYDPIEPVTLLKNTSEHAGKFVKFRAKFSHITTKTKELLSPTIGAKVDLDAYDSFKVYGNGFVFPRMLMSKKKNSNLYELKSDTPVVIYGEVYGVNMVGEPIIIVHKTEETASSASGGFNPKD